MSKFWDFLKGNRLEFVLLATAMTTSTAVEAIAHPLLLKALFDEAIIKKSFHMFVLISLLYLLIAVVLIAWEFFISLWQKRLENRVAQRVSSNLLRTYYDKDYAHVIEKGEGYFISRIYGDVLEGMVPMVDTLMWFLRNVVRAVSFFGVLVYLSWEATLLLLILVPPVMYITSRLTQKIQRLSKAEREAEGKFMDVFVRIVKSYKVVKIFELINKVVPIYWGKIGEFLDENYKTYKSIQIYTWLNYLLMNINTTVSMLVSGYMVFIGNLTFGGFLAFTNTFWRAIEAIMGTISKIGEISRFLAIISRIDEFKNLESATPPLRGERLTLEGVGFSYGDREVLKDFNLTVNPGERVLLTGPNGSGKTTLANIMSGLLKPSRGKVILPEGGISSLTLPVEFPPLKVRELVKDEELLERFSLKGLKDKYPHELSAGQKQKLGVALALSKRASMYVLDEPLANVDRESSTEVMKAIFDRTKGSTLVVIMHRGEEYESHFDRRVTLERNEEVET